MKVGSLKDNPITFEARKTEMQAQDIKDAEAYKRAYKNSPFKRWTQLNNEHTAELIQLALKYPKAHAILYFLVDQMDEYNAVVCSVKVISELLNVSRQTVSKNIKILKEHGFIVILKSGASNVYVINDKVYWKSWSNNKKYSKFPANVVLSFSEQDADYKKTINQKINHVELK
jgi:DNA-binding transcriptional ArsR family regulator